MKLVARLLILSVFLTGCLQEGSKVDNNFYAGVSLSSNLSTLVVSATNLLVGNSITVTLTARDNAGNVFLSDVPLTIAFSHSGGSSTGTFSATTDNGNGTYSAIFTGVTAGTHTLIQGSINGVVVGGNANVQVLALPVISITTSNSDLIENSGTGSFTISLDHAWTTNVSVDVSSLGTATLGTDFTVTPSVAGTITFTPGQTTKSFTITPSDDLSSEGVETIRLQLTNPVVGVLSVANDDFTINLNEFNLDLNFASLFNDGNGFGSKGAPYSSITLTRASNAYFFDADGLLKSAGNNVPRFQHDPWTGQPEGFLVENSATNAMTRSDDITTWTRASVLAFGSGSVTNATSAKAPDGSTNSEIVTEDTSVGTSHNIFKNSTLSPYQVVSFSGYFKPHGTTRIKIRIREVGATGNAFSADFLMVAGGSVPTGGPQGGGSYVQATIKRLPNDWYYCTITGIPNTVAGGATQTQSYVQHLLNGTSTTSYTGDGVSGFYMWGAQIEAGYPSSYIPTAAAAVTRQADVATISPINGFYSATGGTVFSRFNLNMLNPTGANNQTIFAFDDGSATNRIQYSARTGATDNFNVLRSNAGALFTSANLGTVNTLNTDYQFSSSFGSTSLSSSMNGATTVSDSNFTLPGAGLTRLGIGYSSAAQHNLRGSIKRLSYMPLSVDATQLETWSNSTNRFRNLTPALNLAQNALSITINDSPNSFIVGLSERSTAPVTVNWALTGTAVLNTDYTGPSATSGTFTFAPGETRKFLQINAIAGATRTITMTISGPTGATVGATSSSTMTIN